VGFNSVQKPFFASPSGHWRGMGWDGMAQSTQNTRPGCFNPSLLERLFQSTLAQLRYTGAVCVSDPARHCMQGRDGQRARVWRGAVGRKRCLTFLLQMRIVPAVEVCR
jgi:hypothetical protein